MFVRLILIKFALITCVVGIINVNYFNKNETESKFRILESNINQTFYKLESNILDRLISYVDGKTEPLNKKIPQAVNVSNNEIDENLVDKITQMLNASNKKMEEKMAQTLKASNKKMEENLEDKMTQTLKASNKKMEENLEEKMTHTFKALDSMKKEFLGKNTIISNQMPCKEAILRRNRETLCYSMDDETLNHVSLKRNSTGHLIYFEMHVTIEADGYVAINLMDKESDWDSNIRFDIDIGQNSNQYTALDIHSHGTTRSDVIIVHTPDIVSFNTQFRAYFKIDNGKLDFGKEGNDGLLLSYEDTRFSKVNYFRLYRGGGGTDTESKFRYDCPAPVKTTEQNRGS